jgi:hypothetical protein
MSSDFRRLLSWPAAFAILFIAIPPLLFYSHPSSFWANTDYESLGLGDALNLAYRLADIRLYPAIGMEDHPGVPFYFMSWLALALTGYPIAFKGPGFFNAVIDHVETYHRACVWLATLTGGAAVYVFARTARSMVPFRGDRHRLAGLGHLNARDIADVHDPIDRIVRDTDQRPVLLHAGADCL